MSVPRGDDVIPRIRELVVDDPVGARVLAEQCVREQPYEPAARYALALAAATLGEEAFARSALDWALRRAPALAAEAQKDAALSRLLES